MESPPAWPQIALDAVAALKARIPEALRLSPEFLARYPPGSDVRAAAAECGLLTLEELDITDLDQDATSILARIQSKELTAVQVVTAFGKRAAIAHQLLSCLTDFFLDDALVTAQELDKYYNETGRLVGPLHGLPVSIKDHMNIAGRKSTAGFSGDLLNAPAAKHGLPEQIMQEAGAVFYCKTNLPQAIMHLEAHSFWGQVLNPYNTMLTPGGSSGGCSALIAFGGSPLSIGSDIGGSLRSPAAACGIWTLKPTTLRVPKSGSTGPTLGMDSIVPTFGPMCRSLRDVDLWFSLIIGAEPWLREYSLVPIPWRISAPAPWEGLDVNGMQKKIRVGVMWDDGVLRPYPSIRRALRVLVDALERDSSFEVVDYKPFKHLEASELAHELYFPDGGASVRERAAVSGEPLLPLTEWAITQPMVKDHTIHELWELNLKREAFRAAFLEHYNAQNVDVVLCPVAPGPAPPLGTSKYWGYTSFWNLVDYPAAVFPTGLYCDETDAKDAVDGGSDASNDSASTGAPLCLQLVSRRFGDEVVVQALKEISRVLPLSAGK
ncbi:amidase signature domain-containing protein [Mycena rebaudengoi]|nr:amidase signature domain-containing protein [Mycena rebaudengoi]